MSQSRDHALQIEDNQRRSVGDLETQFLRLLRVAGGLTSVRAKEFLSQGIGRRLVLVSRSITRVFEIFPCAREQLLSGEELSDIAINFHSFVININGILDNAALVIAHERELHELLENRQGLALFRRETQRELPRAVREYLQGARLQDWYRTYAKNYRDALAHRVPPYLPPSQVRSRDGARVQALDQAAFQLRLVGRIQEAEPLEAESRSLQEVTPFLTHSFTEDENATPVLLHAQVIADANTINEILDSVFPAALHAP